VWQSRFVGNLNGTGSSVPRAILVPRVVAVLGTIAAAAGALFGWVDQDAPWPQIVILAGGVTAAVATFTAWLFEERRSRALNEEKTSVEGLLEAERIRVLTVTNGAFLPTLASLQHLAALNAADRAAEISGFRQVVVERVCDLVKNEQPRAAFFQVEDPGARIRVMGPRPHIAQKSRVDEFTTQFREDDGIAPEVWDLIDLSQQAVLQQEVELPGKVYHAYISAPVRAGGIAFGMLTVNVLDANGLATEDRDFVLVLARLLAVAEYLALSPQRRDAYRQMSEARSRIGDREVEP
jgi:hypothetical protein